MTDQNTDGSVFKYKDTIIDESDFKRLKLEHDDKHGCWKTIVERNDLQVYRLPENKPFTFKAYMRIGNAKQTGVTTTLVYQLACNLDIRQLWDPVYLEVRTLEQIPDSGGVRSSDTKQDKCDIIYTLLKTPPGVSHRDSCVLRAQRTELSSNDAENPTYSVIMKTTQHVGAPATRKYVRSFTPFHAYLCFLDKDTGDVVLFVYSTHDFGGSIPALIIAQVASRAPVSWHTSLKETALKAARGLKLPDQERQMSVVLRSKL